MLHAGRTARVVVWGVLLPAYTSFTDVACPTRSHPPGPAPRRKPSWPIYDTGNEFFWLWIGPELIYSCALFEKGDDLARAQIRKLDHHIEAAGAPRAERESELPLIWEPIAAAEGMFELLALRNGSDHYYCTLRIWDDNLAACHDQAVALVGEPTEKDFRQYLRISASGFRRGHICLLRMSFRKR